MAQFIFIAQDQQGKRISGRLDSIDREAAIKSLSDKNLIVTKLDPVQEKGWLRGLFSTIRHEDVLLFTQELGAMLDAGIGIVHAMNIISADIENIWFRSIVTEMANGIAGGKQLSEVLRHHEKHFSKLYISMVNAGETSGNLPPILLKLAGVHRKCRNAQEKSNISSLLSFNSSDFCISGSIVLICIRHTQARCDL
ncbi:MAG: type II secretion system F family protein [Candidatus Xenobiia bacterium LiM19]